MTHADIKPAVILLVEDDAPFAEMLRDRLSMKGHEVWLAESGAEAEALSHQVHPNLIIIDLMLPDTNGLVLCANLRERFTGPIIICTASQRPEDPVLGFKLGANDFVRKPFSCTELEARIEAHLRHAGRNGSSAAPTTSSAPTASPAPDDAVPEIKLVILTARSDDETLTTCLQAGAVGYVQLENPPDEALRAIKQMYAGKLQLTPTASPIPSAPPTHDLRSPANHLAPREVELLEALASGLTLDEAARQMGISINTVRTYMKHVMRKLGARTTLHALISAMKSGWINLPE